MTMSRVSGHIFSSYYNKRQDRNQYVTRRNTLTPVAYATKWLNKTKGTDEFSGQSTSVDGLPQQPRSSLEPESPTQLAGQALQSYARKWRESTTGCRYSRSWRASEYNTKKRHSIATLGYERTRRSSSVDARVTGCQRSNSTRHYDINRHEFQRQVSLNRSPTRLVEEMEDDDDDDDDEDDDYYYGPPNDSIRKRPKTSLERELERRERRKRHGCRHCRRNHRNKSAGKESGSVTIEPQVDGRQVEVHCINCNKILATNVNSNNNNDNNKCDDSSGGDGDAPVSPPATGDANSEDQQRHRGTSMRVFIRSCCADFRGRLSKGGGGSLLRAARSGNVERLTSLLDQDNIDIQTSNSSGLAAIHLAAKEGHCEIIKELLKRNAQVDQQTKRGNTALHVASLAGKLSVVRLLIEKGANPNSKAQNAFSPLYMAAQEGHEEIVEYLLKNGANQGIPTEDGFTPLAVALQENKDKVVALLLNNDVKGRVKLPALHIAARKDDVKAAALLLQNDNTADPTSKMMVNRTTESGFTALHIAAHYGNVSVATLLLNRGAIVDFEAKSGITPLHVAAKRGHSRFCGLIMQHNGQPDKATRDGLIPLHCAARSGHAPVVKMLLDEDKTPRLARTKNGLSALHMATQGGHVEVVELLLSEKFPVDDITSDFLSALHIAAHSGFAKIAKLLLANGAKPNRTALNGFTALHVACKKDRVAVVELLLDNKVDIEAVTESGLTPLHIACFMGNFDVVRLLIKKGANLNSVNVRGETALHMATRSGRYDIVEFLLQQGAKPDSRKQESQTCLHLASRLYKTEVIKLLLEYKADVNSVMHDGYTALHVATKENHVEVCQMLLDYGADVGLTTKKGFTALHLASKYGRLEIASLLLKNKASSDASGKDGLTPLHVAAHYDNQHIALLLLQNGASPHLSGKNGYTPLHIAAKKNQMDIALSLLEYNASPDCSTRMDVTPLHLAAQEGNVDMCSVLLSKDAGVNASAKYGLTPIHLAAQDDQVAVAKVLYDNGSLVDPLTKSGCTPLHIAAHHGNIKVANFLLSFGAKVNAKTKNGYTPLHQASQQGHTHVVNLLLQHGASPNELTNNGNTALSLADRLGYVTLVETLKKVTTETTTTIIEERRKMNVPERIGEVFMSDGSDDEADGSAMGGDFLTTTEMKELGDDSIVPTEASLNAASSDARYSVMYGKQPSSMDRRSSISSSVSGGRPDHTTNIRHGGFQVSFVVDARGGSMRSSRQQQLRVIVPPKACHGPTRITCRFSRRRQLTSLASGISNNPSMFDAEGKANRVLEIGPHGTSFLEPVAIEVPHFASLTGNVRQLAVLRSNDGETWKEHKAPCSDEVFIKQHASEDLESGEKLLIQKRILRIITSSFPRYFAIVSRPIENAILIGADGGNIESTVVAGARAFFPEGALTKRITIALQMLPVPADLCKRAIGTKAKASSILTIEPRRRKFHKPIKLTIPLPEGTDMKDYLTTAEDSTLRLLCSISGGADPAQWEDITGSTPLNFLDNCVSFTSTVSARFWLIDCRQSSDSSVLAHQIYNEATRVPYMSKFIIYARSHDQLEACVRIFCLTEDRNERTLEQRENFVEIARSKDIEIFEGSQICLECSGNLSINNKNSAPTRKHSFAAFSENRMQIVVKVRDSTQDPCGRLTFYRASGGPPKSHGARKTLCSLNISLPACDQTSDSESETEDLPLEANGELHPDKKRYYLVDPRSVGTPELRESPGELARDLKNVLTQLNAVKNLLETPSQCDAGESEVNLLASNGSDNNKDLDDIPIDQAASVVGEVRKGLSEVMDILSQEEKALDEIQKNPSKKDAATHTSPPMLPSPSDPSKDALGDLLSRDLDRLAVQLETNPPHSAEKKEDDERRDDNIIEETIKQIDNDEELKRLLSTGEEIIKPQKQHMIAPPQPIRSSLSSHSLDSNFSHTTSHMMRSRSCDVGKSVRFSTCVEIIDPNPASSSRLPISVVPVSDRRSSLPRESEAAFSFNNSRKESSSSSDSSAASSPVEEQFFRAAGVVRTAPSLSLQQRIKAYEAATTELHEEVERFKILTSPPVGMGDQPMSSSVITTTGVIDNPPFNLKPAPKQRSSLKKTDNKQDESANKLQTSPKVLEETHSVHELLKTWEQASPNKVEHAVSTQERENKLKNVSHKDETTAPPKPNHTQITYADRCSNSNAVSNAESTEQKQPQETLQHPEQKPDDPLPNTQQCPTAAKRKAILCASNQQTAAVEVSPNSNALQAQTQLSMEAPKLPTTLSELNLPKTDSASVAEDLSINEAKTSGTPENKVTSEEVAMTSVDDIKSIQMTIKPHVCENLASETKVPSIADNSDIASAKSKDVTQEVSEKKVADQKGDEESNTDLKPLIVAYNISEKLHKHSDVEDCKSTNVKGNLQADENTSIIKKTLDEPSDNESHTEETKTKERASNDILDQPAAHKELSKNTQLPAGGPHYIIYKNIPGYESNDGDKTRRKSNEDLRPKEHVDIPPTTSDCKRQPNKAELLEENKKSVEKHQVPNIQVTQEKIWDDAHKDDLGEISNQTSPVNKAFRDDTSLASTSPVEEPMKTSAVVAAPAVAEVTPTVAAVPSAASHLESETDSAVVKSSEAEQPKKSNLKTNDELSTDVGSTLDAPTDQPLKAITVVVNTPVVEDINPATAADLALGTNAPVVTSSLSEQIEKSKLEKIDGDIKGVETIPTTVNVKPFVADVTPAVVDVPSAAADSQTDSNVVKSSEADQPNKFSFEKNKDFVTGVEIPSTTPAAHAEQPMITTVEATPSVATETATVADVPRTSVDPVFESLKSSKDFNKDKTITGDKPSQFDDDLGLNEKEAKEVAEDSCESSEKHSDQSKQIEDDFSKGDNLSDSDATAHTESVKEKLVPEIEQLDNVRVETDNVEVKAEKVSQILPGEKETPELIEAPKKVFDNTNKNESSPKVSNLEPRKADECLDNVKGVEPSGVNDQGIKNNEELFVPSDESSLASNDKVDDVLVHEKLDNLPSEGRPEVLNANFSPPTEKDEKKKVSFDENLLSSNEHQSRKTPSNDENKEEISKICKPPLDETSLKMVEDKEITDKNYDGNESSNEPQKSVLKEKPYLSFNEPESTHNEAGGIVNFDSKVIPTDQKDDVQSTKVSDPIENQNLTSGPQTNVDITNVEVSSPISHVSHVEEPNKTSATNVITPGVANITPDISDVSPTAAESALKANVPVVASSQAEQHEKLNSQTNNDAIADIPSTTAHAALPTSAGSKLETKSAKLPTCPYEILSDEDESSYYDDDSRPNEAKVDTFPADVENEHVEQIPKNQEVLAVDDCSSSESDEVANGTKLIPGELMSEKFRNQPRDVADNLSKYHKDLSDDDVAAPTKGVREEPVHVVRKSSAIPAVSQILSDEKETSELIRHPHEGLKNISNNQSSSKVTDLEPRKIDECLDNIKDVKTFKVDGQEKKAERELFVSSNDSLNASNDKRDETPIDEPQIYKISRDETPHELHDLSPPPVYEKSRYPYEETENKFTFRAVYKEADEGDGLIDSKNNPDADQDLQPSLNYLDTNTSSKSSKTSEDATKSQNVTTSGDLCDTDKLQPGYEGSQGLERSTPPSLKDLQMSSTDTDDTQKSYTQYITFQVVQSPTREVADDVDHFKSPENRNKAGDIVGACKSPEDRLSDDYSSSDDDQGTDDSSLIGEMGACATLDEDECLKISPNNQGIETSFYPQSIDLDDENRPVFEEHPSNEQMAGASSTPIDLLKPSYQDKLCSPSHHKSHATNQLQTDPNLECTAKQNKNILDSKQKEIYGSDEKVFNANSEVGKVCNEDTMVSTENSSPIDRREGEKSDSPKQNQQQQVQTKTVDVKEIQNQSNSDVTAVKDPERLTTDCNTLFDDSAEVSKQDDCCSATEPVTEKEVSKSDTPNTVDNISDFANNIKSFNFEPSFQTNSEVPDEPELSARSQVKDYQAFFDYPEAYVDTLQDDSDSSTIGENEAFTEQVSQISSQIKQLGENLDSTPIQESEVKPWTVKVASPTTKFTFETGPSSALYESDECDEKENKVSDKQDQEHSGRNDSSQLEDASDVGKTKRDLKVKLVKMEENEASILGSDGVNIRKKQLLTLDNFDKDKKEVEELSDGEIFNKEENKNKVDDSMIEADQIGTNIEKAKKESATVIDLVESTSPAEQPNKTTFEINNDDITDVKVASTVTPTEQQIKTSTTVGTAPVVAVITPTMADIPPTTTGSASETNVLVVTSAEAEQLEKVSLETNSDVITDVKASPTIASTAAVKQTMKTGTEVVAAPVVTDVAAAVAVVTSSAAHPELGTDSSIVTSSDGKQSKTLDLKTDESAIIDGKVSTDSVAPVEQLIKSSADANVAAPIVEDVIQTKANSSLKIDSAVVPISETEEPEATKLETSSAVVTDVIPTTAHVAPVEQKTNTSAAANIAAPVVNDVIPAMAVVLPKPVDSAMRTDSAVVPISIAEKSRTLNLETEKDVIEDDKVDTVNSSVASVEQPMKTSAELIASPSVANVMPAVAVVPSNTVDSALPMNASEAPSIFVEELVSQENDVVKTKMEITPNVPVKVEQQTQSCSSNNSALKTGSSAVTSSEAKQSNTLKLETDNVTMTDVKVLPVIAHVAPAEQPITASTEAIAVPVVEDAITAMVVVPPTTVDSASGTGSAVDPISETAQIKVINLDANNVLSTPVVSVAQPDKTGAEVKAEPAVANVTPAVAVVPSNTVDSVLPTNFAEAPSIFEDALVSQKNDVVKTEMEITPKLPVKVEQQTQPCSNKTTGIDERSEIKTKAPEQLHDKIQHLKPTAKEPTRGELKLKDLSEPPSLLLDDSIDESKRLSEDSLNEETVATDSIEVDLMLSTPNLDTSLDSFDDDSNFKGSAIAGTEEKSSEIEYTQTDNDQLLHTEDAEKLTYHPNENLHKYVSENRTQNRNVALLNKNKTSACLEDKQREELDTATNNTDPSENVDKKTTNIKSTSHPSLDENVSSVHQMNISTTLASNLAEKDNSEHLDQSTHFAAAVQPPIHNVGLLDTNQTKADISDKQFKDKENHPQDKEQQQNLQSTSVDFGEKVGERINKEEEKDCFEVNWDKVPLNITSKSSSESSSNVEHEKVDEMEQLARERLNQGDVKFHEQHEDGVGDSFDEDISSYSQNNQNTSHFPSHGNIESDLFDFHGEQVTFDQRETEHQPYVGQRQFAFVENEGENVECQIPESCYKESQSQAELQHHSALITSTLQKNDEDTVTDSEDYNVGQSLLLPSHHVDEKLHVFKDQDSKLLIDDDESDEDAPFLFEEADKSQFVHNAAVTMPLASERTTKPSSDLNDAKSPDVKIEKSISTGRESLQEPEEKVPMPSSDGNVNREMKEEEEFSDFISPIINPAELSTIKPQQMIAVEVRGQSSSTTAPFQSSTPQGDAIPLSTTTAIKVEQTEAAQPSEVAEHRNISQVGSQDNDIISRPGDVTRRSTLQSTDDQSDGDTSMSKIIEFDDISSSASSEVTELDDSFENKDDDVVIKVEDESSNQPVEAKKVGRKEDGDITRSNSDGEERAVAGDVVMPTDLVANADILSMFSTNPFWNQEMEMRSRGTVGTSNQDPSVVNPDDLKGLGLTPCKENATSIAEEPSSPVDLPRSTIQRPDDLTNIATKISSGAKTTDPEAIKRSEALKKGLQLLKKTQQSFDSLTVIPAEEKAGTSTEVDEASFTKPCFGKTPIAELEEADLKEKSLTQNSSEEIIADNKNFSVDNVPESVLNKPTLVKEDDQLRTLPSKVEKMEKSSERADQPLQEKEAKSTQKSVTAQITSVTDGQSLDEGKNLKSREASENSQKEEDTTCSSLQSGTPGTFDFENFKLHGSHEIAASKVDSSKVVTGDVAETFNNDNRTSANREHGMNVDESYFGIQLNASSIAASSNNSTTAIEDAAKKDVVTTQDAAASSQYARQLSNQDPLTENSDVSAPMLTLSTDRDSVSTTETIVSSQFEPSAFRRGKHVAGSSGEMSADDDFCYRDLRTRNDSSVSADSFRTARQYSGSEGVFTDESASASVVGSYERQRTGRIRAESESKAKDSNAEMSAETVQLDGGTSSSQPVSFFEARADIGKKQLPSNQDEKSDEFATSAGSSSEERFANDDDYMCVGATPDSTYDPDSIASQPLPAIPEDEILSPETICSPELRRRGIGWLSDEEDEEAKAEHMRSFAEKFSAFVASVRGSDDSSTSVLPLQLHQGDGTQPEAKEALASPSRQSTSSISSYLELEKAVFESSQVDDAEAISHISSDYALVSNDDDSFRCDTNFESESFATTTSFTDDLSERVGFTDSFDLDDLDSRSVVSDFDKKRTSRIPVVARRRSQSSPDKPKDETKSSSLRESHKTSTSQSRLRKPKRVTSGRKDREGDKKSKDEVRQRSSQAGSSSTSKLRKVTSRSSLPVSSTPKSTTASKKVKIRKNAEEKTPERQKLRKVPIKKRQESSIVTSPRCASPLSRSSSANSLKSGKPRSIKSGSSSPTTQDLAAMRAEAFKNQASGGRKYIALKEGVYTYKMSLQEEKESRTKLSPLGTGVLSDSGGSSRSGYDNQSRARQDNVSAVLGGGSFLAKGLGLGVGDSCLTVSTSPGNKLVSKIPRKILLKHVEEATTNPPSVGDEVMKDDSKDVAVHATSFSKIRPPAVRRKSPNEPKVNKRQVEAESATNKDQLRASGETISPRYRKLARNVGIQWPRLARALDVNPEHVRKIQMEIDSSDVEAQSTAMFGTWLASNSDNQKDLDEVLLKAFESIDRTELNKYLAGDENIFEERSGQVDHDVSAFHALEAELGSSPYPHTPHVSSPYPYTPNDELRINTSSADATKAEEDNETLNSARDSIYEDADYDSDKPHFIYIQDEDESMSSLQNGEKDYEEKEEKDQDENSNVDHDGNDDEHSSDSSCASVCSEVDNYQRNRDTPQAEEERKSDNMDDDSSDDDALNGEQRNVQSSSESENGEGSYRQAEDSSDDDRPPVRSFSFTVQEN